MGFSPIKYNEGTTKTYLMRLEVHRKRSQEAELLVLLYPACTHWLGSRIVSMA
jgi:hypothetical protein